MHGSKKKPRALNNSLLYKQYNYRQREYRWQKRLMSTQDVDYMAGNTLGNETSTNSHIDPVID